MRDICAGKNIPFAVERSRSGNGAHVWFFFDDKVSAVSARKFGTALLTHAMAKRHEIKFTSYDRLFPNQDTLPKGGLGNLIALPLQLNARRNNNSVFIDAISNFIIKPIEIIEAEEEAQVSAEVINDRGESFRRTFLTTEFGNLQKFKNVLNQNTLS